MEVLSRLHFPPVCNDLSRVIDAGCFPRRFQPDAGSIIVFRSIIDPSR